MGKLQIGQPTKKPSRNHHSNPKKKILSLTNQPKTKYQNKKQLQKRPSLIIYSFS